MYLQKAVPGCCSIWRTPNSEMELRSGGIELGMSRRERRTPNSEMELRSGGIELGKSIRKRRTPKKTERTLDFF